MDFREFVKSKLFVRQLLYAIAASIVIIWGAMKLLDAYTRHGRTITVPDLLGQYEPDIGTLLSDSQLEYMINDSIFSDEGPKGSVFSQDPPPGTKVKRGRTIYLTTIAVMPEMVPMPNLSDLSLRQAISILTAYGLKPGQLEYRPDIAQNAVLQQKFNRGAIEPGTLVAKGTAIDLVLGQGLGDNVVLVPVLVGKTRTDAIAALHASSLNVGNEFFLDEDVEDHSGDLVFEQHPNSLTRKEYLQAGSSVDLYFRSPDVFDFETYLNEQLTVLIPLLFGKNPEEARLTLESYGLKIGDEVFEERVSEANARVYRQEPAYEEDVLVRIGSEIKIWYRPIESFDLDLLENQPLPDDDLNY